LGTGIGQLLQGLLGELAISDGFFGVDVPELIEREGNALYEAVGLFQSLGILAKEPFQTVWMVDEALGIAREKKAGVFNGDELTDAGQHVPAHLASGLMVERVRGRTHGRLCMSTSGGKSAHSGAVMTIEAMQSPSPNASAVAMLKQLSNADFMFNLPIPGHDDH
jgi:hypothetical protein